MNRFIAIVAIAAVTVAGMGCATPTSMTAFPASQASSAELPWDRARAIVQATDANISKGGITAIRTHVEDLETALAGAGKAFEMAGASSNPRYVLTDGAGESLAALLLASAGGSGAPGQQVVAVPNPYPIAAFFLGTYYNEIGRPAEALRALDTGLALPTAIPGSDRGESRPLLIAERGAALFSLRRWQEGLANFDRGLAINGLNNTMRARMLRGRGFALIELERLDEAETAFRDSLASEPNNQNALTELTYIARLRAGGPRAPSALSTPMPQPSR